MSELKPCPFCGYRHVYVKSEAADPFDDVGRFYYVYCPNCQARSGASYASNGNDCPIFYSEVRDEWNRRADDQDPLI